MLGGDHSIAEPDIRACAEKHGPVGLVHFDTHTDTGTEVFGVEISHGTPMYRLVEGGSVDPKRYVQIGLRGYWPGPAEFAWQAEKGITSFFAHDVRELGIEEVVGRTLGIVGDGPGVRLDRRGRARPRVRARDRHARAGRAHLRRAALGRATAAAGLEVVGADVVEVLPTAVGSADITALVAERIVREVMTGIALRRRSAGK